MSEPQWPYTVSREIGLRVAETLKVPMSHALQGIQSMTDLSLSLGRTSRAMRGLEIAIYHAACALWLETHQRLPGSTRTRRLHKKRRAMVFRAWFGDF
jgi:hypothetical protein